MRMFRRVSIGDTLALTWRRERKAGDDNGEGPSSKKEGASERRGRRRETLRTIRKGREGPVGDAYLLSGAAVRADVILGNSRTATTAVGGLDGLINGDGDDKRCFGAEQDSEEGNQQ